MEITAKQYETVVNSAAEISQVLLDMEGGKYVLAMFSELVRELLNEENFAGATLAVRKLHETTEVPLELDTLAEENTTAWILLFAEAMGDSFKESAFWRL